MIDLSHRILPQEKSRALLRKLRDLNLTAGPIAVTSSARVAFAGCTSTDVPAENGVRYRVHLADGSENTLEIQGRPEGLEISLCGRGAGSKERRLLVAVTCDRTGRACARQLGARVAPETRDPRELEHFLRRIVRSIFAKVA